MPALGSSLSCLQATSSPISTAGKTTHSSPTLLCPTTWTKQCIFPRLYRTTRWFQNLHIHTTMPNAFIDNNLLIRSLYIEITFDLVSKGYFIQFWKTFPYLVIGTSPQSLLPRTTLGCVYMCVCVALGGGGGAVLKTKDCVAVSPGGNGRVCSQRSRQNSHQCSSANTQSVESKSQSNTNKPKAGNGICQSQEHGARERKASTYEAATDSTRAGGNSWVIS